MSTTMNVPTQQEKRHGPSWRGMGTSRACEGTRGGLERNGLAQTSAQTRNRGRAVWRGG